MEYLVDCRRTQFAAIRVEAENENDATKSAEMFYAGSKFEGTTVVGSFHWEDDSFEAFDAEPDE